MKKEKIPVKKPVRKIVWFVLAALLLVVLTGVAFSLFTGRTAVRTLAEYREAFPEAVITVAKDGSVELGPGAGIEPKKTGIVFYAGAQIEPEAYIPLMARLAENGYFIAVPKLPLRMASLKPNAALAAIQAHPEIENWYAAGHSMGGLTASGFSAEHTDAVKGVILLAAYSIRDMSAFPLPVLSVYGDRDTVLNRKNYEKFLTLRPAGLEEHILPGGNHAQFGDYGLQPRDGEASISSDEQQTLTAGYMLAWLETQEKENIA